MSQENRAEVAIAMFNRGSIRVAMGWTELAY